METIVDAQLLIDSLTEQRNQAQDRSAVAAARSVMFQRQAEVLRGEVADLKKKLAEKTDQGSGD